MWSDPDRVSTSWTLMSGFTPGVILRNTFIRQSSPNATDEFDCSPENSVECVSRSRSWPGSRWKRSPLASSCRLPPLSPSAASKDRSQRSIASRSCRASYACTQPCSGSSHQPMKAWSSRCSGSV